MKRRIFISLTLLTALSLLIVSVSLSLFFYSQLSGTVRADLRQQAAVFADNDLETAMTALRETASDWMRVSLIRPDGSVAYDNTIAAGQLPNHLDREEVAEALAAGTGESNRYFETLHEETFYFAVRLTDGAVLRLAKTTDSILGMSIGSLPMVVALVLLLMLAGYFLSGIVTRWIVAPINRVRLDQEPSAPYDELAPFVRTITEQRSRIQRQMEDLQNRADTIEAIMDSMSEGIVIVNRQGAILSVNKSAAAFLGIGAPVTGKNILELFRDMALLTHMRDALSGQRAEAVIEHGGRVFRTVFSPVAGIGAIILFLDITERIQAETLRREFSANVSHELKTPLTTIYGNAEMLAGGMVRESDRPQFYERIKDEAGRMIELIEDILLISRLDEAGGDAREAVDLQAIAREAIEALTQKAAAHQVTLAFSGGPVRLEASRLQMYELVTNLADNAIKYNKPGGSVRVTLAEQDGEVVLTVVDTGIGIPKEEQERVFERFYRVDRSRSRKTGGTGLGLAIVKHIVLAHGGRLEISSQEQEGTTIRVYFRTVRKI